MHAYGEKNGEGAMTATLLRNLSDRQYEKRKLAALEIETRFYRCMCKRTRSCTQYTFRARGVRTVHEMWQCVDLWGEGTDMGGRQLN